MHLTPPKGHLVFVTLTGSDQKSMLILRAYILICASEAVEILG